MEVRLPPESLAIRRYALDEPPFAGGTGAGVRVAVIDSGIAPGHPHVGGAVAAGLSFIDAPGDTADRVGHGTAVAAVIREKARDAELVPVRVFAGDLRVDAETLAEAIEWAADHGCDLINLSLGTANAAHAARLEAAVAHALARGCRIVAAHTDRGTEWLPGSLAGVEGVVVRPVARDEVERLDASVEGAAWGASPYPRPIPGVPPDRNLSGISFAVANVTGFLARATGR